MEIRMDGKSGPTIKGIDPVLAEIQRRLQVQPREWLKSLEQDPGKLANLEQEIHGVFARMADHVVEGLLAQATAGADFVDAAQKK